MRKADYMKTNSVLSPTYVLSMTILWLLGAQTEASGISGNLKTLLRAFLFSSGG